MRKIKDGKRREGGGDIKPEWIQEQRGESRKLKKFFYRLFLPFLCSLFFGFLVTTNYSCYVIDSMRPTLPDHNIAHDYCFCGYCNDTRFYSDDHGEFWWGSCPPDLPGCTDSVRIDGYKVVTWGNGHLIDDIYCISEGAEQLQNVEEGVCENAGYVNECWDWPLCNRPDWCPMSGPEYIPYLQQILPPDPPVCTEKTHANSHLVTAILGSDDVAADTLIPMCMVHGYDPPSFDNGEGPERFCFLPYCIWFDPDAYADEPLDPPSVTSRSSIFEVPPDGSSYAQFEGPSGVFTSHVSGYFTIDFSPYCAEDFTCDAALSYLEIDTNSFEEGPWELDFEDDVYLLSDFTVINKKWSYGEMAPSGPGHSTILFPDTEQGRVELYVSGETDHGLRGVSYSDPECRMITYRWDDGAAFMNVSYIDDRGEFSIRLVGRAIARPPHADAGDDIDLSCEEELIHLDGSGSTDPDSDIATHNWSLVSAEGEWKHYTGKVIDIPVEFDMGTTSIIALDVVDGNGLADSDELMVTVGDDDKPPVVESIELPVSCLWPHEHEKVKFRLWEDIIPHTHDVCGDGPVDVRIVNATSSQPENSWIGDGDTEDDVTFNDTTVCLRAEVNAFRIGEDRIYTVVLRFEDEKGNFVQETIEIRVPYSFTEEDKETCGNLDMLDFVREDDQECMGREGQYPPAPEPPSWCRSSITGGVQAHVGFPLLMLLLTLLVLVVRRRK